MRVSGEGIYLCPLRERDCAPISKHNFPLDLNELQDSSSFMGGILKDTNVACAVVSPSASSIPN
jgi:hypothetical protein